MMNLYQRMWIVIIVLLFLFVGIFFYVFDIIEYKRACKMNESEFVVWWQELPCSKRSCSMNLSAIVYKARCIK